MSLSDTTEQAAPRLMAAFGIPKTTQLSSSWAKLSTPWSVAGNQNEKNRRAGKGPAGGSRHDSFLWHCVPKVYPGDWAGQAYFALGSSKLLGMASRLAR